MRRSRLPAYCHSPSVIRDKKNLRDTSRLESLGVRVAYQSSPIKQMPRDGQRSSSCQDTLLMSLFPSTSSLHTPSLDRRSFPCVPSPPRSLSVSKIAVCVESQRSKNLSQLKGKRKGRLGSCLWSWAECLRVDYVCRVVSAGMTLSSLQVNLLNLRNLMHLILHLWGLMLRHLYARNLIAGVVFFFFPFIF